MNYNKTIRIRNIGKMFAVKYTQSASKEDEYNRT